MKFFNTIKLKSEIKDLKKKNKKLGSDLRLAKQEIKNNQKSLAVANGELCKRSRDVHWMQHGMNAMRDALKDSRIDSDRTLSEAISHRDQIIRELKAELRVKKNESKS